MPGAVGVLLETTAGCGTALGSTFEELAALRARIGKDVRDRVGFCADTCHLYSAGYDLGGDYDGVWRRWDEILGLGAPALPPPQRLEDTVRLPARPARADRRRIARSGAVPPDHARPAVRAGVKVIETPKGDDEVTFDRRMLRRLRAYARGPR